MMKRALVLCTGNSCRSIMAEAMINQLGDGRISAVSAGSNPTGQVHPKSIETLRRNQIAVDADRVSSKSWEKFAGQNFDFVITVCDSAANESCPLFAGGEQKLHWSTPDPASINGSARDVEAAFDHAFVLLKDRIEALVAQISEESDGPV